MNGRLRNSGSDWIRRSTRMAIYHRDEFRCAHCFATEGLSLHHIDKARGNGPENLVTLCSSCNLREETNPCECCNAVVFPGQAGLPLNRAEGLRLAKLKWPARFARERQRKAAKKPAPSFP